MVMGLWLLMMAASAAFAPIKVYEGTWSLVAAHTMAGEGKPDTIVNHRTEGTAFYTCEQVVNGKSLALIVFTATDDPTKFHTQPVLPNGKAVGRGDLTIVGDHWTYSSSGRRARERRSSTGPRTFLRDETRFISSSMSPEITRLGSRRMKGMRSGCNNPSPRGEGIADQL